jgi:hypothetical protein
MYGLHSVEGYMDVLPGIGIKTIATGERVLMTKFSLRADAKLPCIVHRADMNPPFDRDFPDDQ